MGCSMYHRQTLRLLSIAHRSCLAMDRHPWRCEMSSLDKFPDWSVFSEREVPFDVELLSPAAEVVAVLQGSQAALDEARQEVKDVRREYLEALAQQAVLVVQLAAVLDRYAPDYTQASLAKVHRSLRIVKDQMLDELGRAGLEIII